MQSTALQVKSQDVELFVRVQGDARNPTLLFLHGFPDCHRTWHKQMDALQEHYQVVSFDMRGVGQSTASSRRNAYRIKHLLADVEAVIDAVAGKEGQVHLIGHDWGSVIGWSFITEDYYAQRVLSFTSLSGPHLGLMLSWARRSVLSARWRHFKELAQQSMSSWYVGFINVPKLPELLLQRFGLSAWRRALRGHGVDARDKYLDISQAELNGITLNALGLYRQNILTPPDVPLAKGIKVPVQLMVATQDAFISEYLYRYYDEYVESLQLQHITAKHWAHHSHSKKFNRCLEQFVRQVEGNT